MANRYEERDRDERGFNSEEQEGSSDWRNRGRQNDQGDSQMRNNQQNYQDDHSDWQRSGSYGQYGSSQQGVGQAYTLNRDQFEQRSNQSRTGRQGRYQQDQQGWGQRNAGMNRSTDWERGGDAGQQNFGQGYGQNSQTWNRDDFNRQGQQNQSGQGYFDYGRSAQGQTSQLSQFNQSNGQTQGQFAGRGPKGYKRSDERIKEDLSEELTRHRQIDASEIEVQVQNGEVTLTGTVQDRQTKRLAEDVAESISGIHDVINQIRVNREGQANQNRTSGSSGMNSGAHESNGSSSTSTVSNASDTGGTSRRKS